MIQYDLQIEHAYNSEYGAYVTYGVTAYFRGKVVCTVEDISLDKNKVEQLVKCFNEEQLSPAHLEEEIENYLYDFTL